MENRFLASPQWHIKSYEKQSILGRPYSEEAFFGSFFGRLQKMNNQGDVQWPGNSAGQWLVAATKSYEAALTDPKSFASF